MSRIMKRRVIETTNQAPGVRMLKSNPEFTDGILRLPMIQEPPAPRGPAFSRDLRQIEPAVEHIYATPNHVVGRTAKKRAIGKQIEVRKR